MLHNLYKDYVTFFVVIVISVGFVAVLHSPQALAAPTAVQMRSTINQKCAAVKNKYKVTSNEYKEVEEVCTATGAYAGDSSRNRAAKRLVTLCSAQNRSILQGAGVYGKTGAKMDGVKTNGNCQQILANKDITTAAGNAKSYPVSGGADADLGPGGNDPNASLSGSFDQVCNAQTSNTNKPADSAYCKDAATSENPLTGNDGTINRIANLVAVIGGAVAVIIIIIGGFMMVVSSGDAQKFASGRSAVIYALVGLLIIAVAKLIVSFVINKTLE